VIEKGRGDLLAADVEALVNAVNTVGVMGKGLALQFKQAYPASYRAYRSACDRGELSMGHMHLFDTGSAKNPRYVINFPTKKHWRSQSRLSDIEEGLAALVALIRELDIESVAIPALGCGNGGLAWGDVFPLIQRACAEIPQVRTLVFAPDVAR
jgi:O-acetyl-ADP-ribose deacetylase (regulator of RNase III)